jgi:hypothetical protein
MPQIEIRVKGHLDQSWSNWLAGLAIDHAENDETLMSGPIVDQAALYGLVSKLRDIGLPLLSIRLVENGDPAGSNTIPSPDLANEGEI